MKRVRFLMICVVLLLASCAKKSDMKKQLIQIAKDGNLNVVWTSLSHGVSANARDKHGEPALIWAANSGRAKVVKLLIDKDANVNARRHTDGLTALEIASAEGHMEVVKLLLEKGHDVNVKRTINGVSSRCETDPVCTCLKARFAVSVIRQFVQP